MPNYETADSDHIVLLEYFKFQLRLPCHNEKEKQWNSVFIINR